MKSNQANLPTQNSSRIFPMHLWQRTLWSHACSKSQSFVAMMLTLAAANAGTLVTDFSSDPGGTAILNRDYSQALDGGVLKLVDLADAIDETGTFVVARLPLQGSYVFPEIDAGQKVGSFTVDFKVRVGGGTERSSQGFSLVFANDFSDTVPFRESGGTTTGLTISFDQADARAPETGAAGVQEGNDPGDAPGIIIKQGGRKVIAKRFDELRTDGPGGDHPPVFVPVHVKLDSDGTLDITYNGKPVYVDVPIGYVPIEGRFGFGAGTEEQTAISRDNFWIDDVSITTTPATGAQIVSVSPGTFDVSANAAVVIGIDGLGGGTVQLEFDGKVVAPTQSTTGSTTTVTYTPPLMDPGSTHSVKLTYAGKTFLYGFTVATAPIVPATAAAPAGSVDLTTSGFKVRVHQTAEIQSNATALRAERQLAGELGANIADLSAANPDGTFNLELINMDQDGTERGEFNATEGHADDSIPGIAPATDYAAMEVAGYLELQPGAYSIGAVSDDSLRLTLGGDPRDVTSLRLIDIPGGSAVAPFIIQQAGIYPIRALWTDATGPANLELWSQDGAGQKILLNDRATPGHIKSYRQRAANATVTPYLSRATPGPGDLDVSTRPKIDLTISDDTTTVDQSSIKLSVNDGPVAIPTGAITKSGKLTSIKFDLPSTLTGKAVQKLKLEFADNTGKAVTREYTFTTGVSTGGNRSDAVKGYWSFDKGNLSADIGKDLAFIDESLSGLYKFGVTGQGDFASVPNINGQPARVMFLPYVQTSETDAKGPIHPRLGLKAVHGIPPNGGSTKGKVNQYTLILDVLWGDTGFGFGPIMQLHDLGAPGDADMFWQRSSGAYGKSCCSPYAGMDPSATQEPGEWARVVFSVDLAANPPVLAKYINGVKHTDRITGDRGVIDSFFALNTPNINFFADEDNERQDMWVNAIQIREGRMSDEEVAALGGPNANGIPLPYSAWDFDDPNQPLAATVGQDLQFIDSSLAGQYKFGVTGQGDFASVPKINGRPASVMFLPYVQTSDTDAKGPIHPRLGLQMLHSLAPNGGSTKAKVNQYTLILDLLWGDTGFGFGPIMQLHDLGAPGDADMFWQRSSGAYGKSCCSPYAGMDPSATQEPGEWARVVFAVDLAANPPVLAKYINGVKHTDRITGDRGVLDSFFALNTPNINLFADEDNERQDMWVNSVQIRQGRMSDEEVAALGGPSADGIPTPNPIKGEWNFDNLSKPLEATVGKDLAFIDDSLAGTYKFGTTGQGDFADVPNINGQPAKVMFLPYVQTSDTDAKGAIHPRLGLKTIHGIAPNGGSTKGKVNQYTLILDLLWGETGFGFGPIMQLHDLGAPGDADMFWQRSSGAYGKSCCSPYAGMDPNATQEPGEWARVVFAVDLVANPPVLAKYINGVKHIDRITGDRGVIDSFFALNTPNINLFADEDNERQDMWVNAIQIREGRMSDEEVAALGGPNAGGIPSASIGSIAPATGSAPPQLTVVMTGQNLTISWPAAVTGFTLESTDRIGPLGTWVPVTAVLNNAITLPSPTGSKFYRLRK